MENLLKNRKIRVTPFRIEVLEAFNSFENATGKKVNYKLVDRREGDITAAYADTTLANTELGWKAELSLDEALLSAWKWQQTL